MSDNNIEIFYNIKAMYMEAYKNPQFMAYTTGIINELLSQQLKISGFGYNGTNRYIEVTVESDNDPMQVTGILKTVLAQYIYSCILNLEVKSILYLINKDTFAKFFHMVKDNNPAELMKITNYMYSILFLGNTASGHLFRIMM